MTHNRQPFSAIQNDTIEQGLARFKAQMGIGTSGRYKSQTAYSYPTDEHKIGAESIYSIDALKALGEVGIGVGQIVITTKTATTQDKNLFVTTGAYPISRIEKGRNAEALSLDGDTCHKVMNLFLEMDLKGETLKEYHDSMKQGTVSTQIARLIDTEIDRLSKIPELKQAPNVCVLSKNGIHFHYQLDLLSGWSSLGLQHLYELPLAQQEAFAKEAGTRSISDLEAQYFNEQAHSTCIRSWWKAVFKKNELAKFGYDDKVLDIGSRKCREIGMWHTKDINAPWLMKPYVSYHLSQKPLHIEMKENEKEQAAKMEKFHQIMFDALMDDKKPHRMLKGDEVVAIGSIGKKAVVDHESITVQELQDNWENYISKYGKKDKVQLCLDFLSTEVARPYESIGSAFATQSADKTIFINLQHTMKPKNNASQEVSLFILPEPNKRQAVTRKKMAMSLNLSTTKEGAVKKTITNLLAILQKDPVIIQAYKLDVLRGVMCVHHLLHTNQTRPNNSIAFDEPLGQQIESFVQQEPFSTLLCEMMSEQDLIVLQSYILQVYGISFEKVTMWEALVTAFSTSQNLTVKFNLLHTRFREHHDAWVQRGKKAVLDTWLPESLHVDKMVNPEYYKHLSLVGRKLLLGICHRAYAFDSPIKLELMLAILGKAQNTGKSTMTETLIRSLMGVWGTESSVVGALDSRFILQTRQDDSKTGDQILSYAGKLIYLLEEFGHEQMSKKGANLLKTMISEKSITGRTPYSKASTTLNFTHTIISTTNDEQVLHQADGDQRRFLIVDLDKKGNDGNFAIVLGNKPQRYNTNNGNKGFIDNKRMAELLKDAWGEAYARAIHGDIDPKIDRDLLSQRSARHVHTGQVIQNANIYCEMPRLNVSERECIAAFNKGYEMRNDRIDDLLYKFFSERTSSYRFSFDDIMTGIEEKSKVKNPAIVVNALKGLKYPLARFTTKNRNVWCFVDTQGNPLSSNPYENWESDSEQDNPVIQQAQEVAQEKAQLIAYMQNLEEELKRKHAELTALKEAQTKKDVQVVLIPSTPVEYGFTPEIEEDDDDRIIEFVASSSMQPSTQPPALDARYMTASIPPAPDPKEQQRKKRGKFISPLDSLDENNIPPSIDENMRKSFKKH